MKFLKVLAGISGLKRPLGMILPAMALALGLGAAPAGAQQANSKAQEIANHFSSIKTMMGDFVQFGPRGDQTGGKFYIARPGKVRFNYDAPSPMRVISDGRTLVVGNIKLGTWDQYPLSKTPLALLLDDKIDLTGKMVRSVKQDPDLVTIVLGDKSVFGDSSITMMFDPATNDLRQWTITDAQGKETSVMIYNVKAGVDFAGSVFALPYDQMKPTAQGK
ncbi:outer membrane lipoprotein-sorting protein [Rhizobium aquaticum]|uniref:Outer membrane lipoprotein-sorting protein n=2 Tax=Rhizobium aquaticum TaxID=1549636 RepID=A0ABV2J3X2_9HYPH